MEEYNRNFPIYEIDWNTSEDTKEPSEVFTGSFIYTLGQKNENEVGLGFLVYSIVIGP